MDRGRTAHDKTKPVNLGVALPGAGMQRSQGMTKRSALLADWRDMVKSGM
ncbi:MAG TPA: hypothetical protein VGL27_02845 [Negativicutes bacterium]